MTSDRLLYHHPLCAFSRKVRLCLDEKKLEYTLVLEKPWERREDFIGLNPAGKVPVLQDKNGAIVAESPVIVEYVEEIYPHHTPLLGKNRIERNEVRRLEFWFDDTFYHEVTYQLVYQKVFKRFFESSGPDSRAMRLGLEAIHTHLEYIGYLVEERNWLSGEDLTMADLAAAAHLSCVDYLGDVPWEQHPLAKTWYARLKSRPSFRPLLSEVMQGVRPSEHYTNLDF